MPRKTLQQRKNPTEDNDNRVRGVVDTLIGIEKPDDIMTELITLIKWIYGMSKIQFKPPISN